MSNHIRTGIEFRTRGKQQPADQRKKDSFGEDDDYHFHGNATPWPLGVGVAVTNEAGW